MKNNKIRTTAAAVFALVILGSVALSGCGRKTEPTVPSGLEFEPIPVETTAPAEAEVTAEEAAKSEPAGAGTGSGREDGERFEDVIMIEGMEEPVQYEHVKNTALGFEMDYDWELFLRRSEADRECFISVYDDPSAPENYLEVTFSQDDAETAAASLRPTTPSRRRRASEDGSPI